MAQPMRRMAAYYELLALAGFTHMRPNFGVKAIESGGLQISISEKIILDSPFASLMRFEKEAAEDEPKILVIAPMSGHFASLLRGAVKTLLREHDVYITDWKNARDVSLRDGSFGLDDFVTFVIDCVHAIGPDCHVMAVCQPAVAALAATAILAAEKDPDQPASLTLMAGPIDARMSPTKVNELATEKPLDWFEKNMIGVVPARLAGAGRLVYPGFLQLSAFMCMNVERHAKSFINLFQHRVDGDWAKADAIRAFYEEYFAIMDLPAEFYLETVREVFQRHSLARGEMKYRGRPVDPGAIRRTFLLTVEGERDDICAVGQTLAAQDLCRNLKPYKKTHHMQPGVGHYGVFSGKKWETQIYPVLRNHIRSSM